MRNSDQGETGNETKVTYLSPGPPQVFISEKAQAALVGCKIPIIQQKGRGIIPVQKQKLQSGREDRQNEHMREKRLARKKN